MINSEEDFYCKITSQAINKNFSHCSIHAPAYAYMDDDISHKTLQYLENLCKKLPIKNIVFHPDEIKDRSFFEKYKHLPLSIENMDDRKKS
jgi:hypothetical protein